MWHDFLVFSDMDKVLCQQYLSDLSLVGFERNTKGITISGIDTPPPPHREVFVGVLGVGGEGTSHRANESCFCTVIIPSQEAKMSTDLNGLLF